MTATDPRILAAELICTWRLEDDADLRREFGIDETGYVDGQRVNTKQQARALHGAIMIAGR